MKAPQVALSLFALFGLCSALTSLLPAAPIQAQANPHGLNGCDPGVPPLILSDMGAVPLTFYSETLSGQDEEKYIVSFLPPKPMMVQADGATQKISFDFRTLHEVTFTYKISTGVLTGTFNKNAHKDHPGVGGVAFDPQLVRGTFDPNGVAIPLQAIEVPPPASNKKRVMLIAQFKGLIVGFSISDQ